MSASERNFLNFQLGDNVYELAGGLLPEMAAAMGYDIGDEPSTSALQGFIGHISPEKELQKNIALTKERLAPLGEPDTITADWVERSGALEPVHRSFAKPEIRVPAEIDTAIITGGVARWILRRQRSLSELMRWGDLRQVGQIVVAAGSRPMGMGEHELVGRLAEHTAGKKVLESDFAKQYVSDTFRDGNKTWHISVPGRVGSEVMDAAAAVPGVLDGTVMVVGNAPSTIQTAGEFRLAARGQDASFDSSGEQLFMSGDHIAVARHGEGPATHQNPYSALGQVARDALLLHLNGSY